MNTYIKKSIGILVALLLLFTFVGDSQAHTGITLSKISEASATKAYCSDLGGIEEARVYYELGYVKVDCFTATAVIEAGLDKRSSLDSLQQAVFFSVLTDKPPVVVIYDTDGIEGKYEYRIRKACEALNIEYRSIRIVLRSNV